MAPRPIYATGRRKTSQARVFAYKATEGNGEVLVNKIALERYFGGRGTKIADIIQPLGLSERMGQYKIRATVCGGGYAGQAGALRLGIARVLEKAEPELRPALKKAGLLTRDSREVERKKPGRHKARRSTQFSKR